MPTAPSCPLHADDRLELVCTSCGDRPVVCAHCLLVGAHKGHAFHPIEEEWRKEARPRLEARSASAQPWMDSLLAAAAEMEALKGRLAETKERVQSDLRERVKDSMDALVVGAEALERDLGEETDRFAAVTLGEMDAVGDLMARMDAAAAHGIDVGAPPETWIVDGVRAANDMDALVAEADAMLASTHELALANEADPLVAAFTELCSAMRRETEKMEAGVRPFIADGLLQQQAGYADTAEWVHQQSTSPARAMSGPQEAYAELATRVLRKTHWFQAAHV